MSAIIETKNGTVRGVTWADGFCWKGIPYAQPPVGGLRFRHAQPVKDWEGILDATQFGPACPQRKRKRRTVDEDCLTLNIWSSKNNLNHAKPVLFYIHGGSFSKGAGSDPEYDGRKLAARGDVLVVTCNYRLGALGFMDFSSLDSSFQSNCGLSDVLEALRWVHGNIAAFGGDPGNITVIGQSAGAIIAATLATIPAAKPYIAKIIMMSGGLNWLHSERQARELAKGYLEFAGIESPRQLMEMPAQKLAALQKNYTRCSGYGENTFAIQVDGNFVPEYPMPAAAFGAASDIPMLIGTTAEETIFARLKPLERLLDLKDAVMYIISREERETLTRMQEIYNKYGKKARAMMMGDSIFRMSSLWYAQVCSKFSGTWMYRFDYATPIMKAVRIKAFHSCDIPFIFGNTDAGNYKLMFLFGGKCAGTDKVAEEVQNDFLAFARTGVLDWERCHPDHTNAKCYDHEAVQQPMVAPEIVAAFNRSAFKRRCFTGKKLTYNISL